ncbi:hypothetical protein Tco_0191428 [Tanacetum coccineum]
MVPLRMVGDKAVHKELGDRMERAATTASSSEAEQDSEASIRNDLLLDDAEATEEVGEDSVPPTNSTQIPIIDQPSTSSQPKKKQKSKRKQRKEAETAHTETEEEEHLYTPTMIHYLVVMIAVEIASLKKRVSMLEKKRQLRSIGVQRFKKLGTTRRVKSSNAGLGAQEDASKQERSIEDIDADAEVSLMNEQQNEDLMFDTGVLDDDEVFVDVATSKKDKQSTKLDDSTTSEAITTASVKDSADPTIYVSTADIGEVTTAEIDELTLAQTLIEINAAKPKVVTTAATTTRPKAMMEADRLLLKTPKSKNERSLTDRQKKLFMELIEKRRKHFTTLRAQEKRNRYTYKQLKGNNFDEIQNLFDKEKKRVNTFVAMGSEEHESKEKKTEGSKETAKGSRKKMLGRKRAGKQQLQESLKKQRMEEDKESDEVKEINEDDEGELLKHLVIKKDEDIAIDAIPLAPNYQ